MLLGRNAITGYTGSYPVSSRQKTPVSLITIVPISTGGFFGVLRLLLLAYLEVFLDKELLRGGQFCRLGRLEES